MPSLGSAYISIFPQMKGFKKAVSGEMAGAGRAGGSRLSQALGKAGDTAGRGFGRTFRASFTQGSQALGADAIAGLTASRDKAASAFKKASNQEANAAKAVEVAEKRLSEARVKHGEGSSQVAQAELRLQQARQKQAEATETAKAKAAALEKAEASLKTATEQAAKAAEQQAGKLSRLGDAFKTAGSTASKGFTKAFQSLPNAIQAPLGKVGTALGSMAGSLAGTAAGGLSAVKTTFSKAWAALPEGLQNLPGRLGQMAGSLSGAVAGGLSALRGTFSDAFSFIGSAAAAAGTAIATGLAAAGKSALDEYANWQQLSGGVETLFKNSAGTVAANAAKAFQTTGMSANKYMENVTGFSAAMISSLGGDTEKAANIADMAMRDMSDNANKMGTSIDSITATYQSLSRGNYAMLDNLKLGYGGTKEQMEKLLADAEALTGRKFDISNFADITEAIHAIQDQWGITGTTAQEAATTLEGSANSMKASWSNLLGAMGNGQDTAGALSAFVDSVKTYLGGNLLPAVRNIAGNMVDTLGAALAEKLPGIGSALQGLGDLIKNGFGGKGIDFGSMFSGLAPVIGGIMGALGPLLSKLPLVGRLFTSLTGPVGILIGAFTAMWNNSSKLREAVSALFASFQGLSGGGILDALGSAFSTVSNVISEVAGVVGDLAAQVIAAIVPLIPRVIALVQQVFPIAAQIVGIIGNIITWLVGHLAPVVSSVISTVIGVIQPIAGVLLNVASWVAGMVGSVVGWFANFRDNITQVMTTVSGWIASKVAAIVGFFQNLRATVAGVMGSFRATVSNAVNAVIGFFTSLPGRIRGALAGAGSWLVSVGRDMVNGLINGIGNFAGRVFGKLKSGIDSAIGSVKSFLGIGSPSKLMRDQIGQWIPPGIAVGVEKAMPEALKDMQATLDTVGELKTPPVGLSLAEQIMAVPAGNAAQAAAGPAAGLVPQRVVYQTINVEAIDPASVAAVLRERERVALGA